MFMINTNHLYWLPTFNTTKEKYISLPILFSAICLENIYVCNNYHACLGLPGQQQIPGSGPCESTEMGTA